MDRQRPIRTEIMRRYLAAEKSGMATVKTIRTTQAEKVVGVDAGKNTKMPGVRSPRVKNPGFYRICHCPHFVPYLALY